MSFSTKEIITYETIHNTADKIDSRSIKDQNQVEDNEIATIKVTPYDFPSCGHAVFLSDSNGTFVSNDIFLFKQGLKVKYKLEVIKSRRIIINTNLNTLLQNPIYILNSDHFSPLN